MWLFWIQLFFLISFELRLLKMMMWNWLVLFLCNIFWVLFGSPHCSTWKCLFLMLLFSLQILFDLQSHSNGIVFQSEWQRFFECVSFKWFLIHFVSVYYLVKVSVASFSYPRHTHYFTEYLLNIVFFFLYSLSSFPFNIKNNFLSVYSAIIMWL